ncbi:MAG: glycerol dehydrogenase [Oscillospiraceae bacterium]|nr:glycerol dehydrogenase [Oscillospiraceae bacterium]
MRIAVVSPSKYIQQAGIISEIGAYTAVLGKSALVVMTSNNALRIGKEIRCSLEKYGCRCIFADFSGDTTQAEIERIASYCTKESCDVIIGAGGGQALDTARAAANMLDKRLLIFPTVASNDAPCSAIAVIHNESGQVVEVRELKHNPDVVLVDTEIIAKAPARFLVSGIGDALATWYEARACAEKGIKTHAGGCTGRAALALAQLCRDTLFELGVQAIESVRRGEVTEAVEEVVHAAIYLSGFGFENGGVAASHAVNDGFTALPQAAKLLHGELVGFGILIQLELENNHREKKKVCDFMRKIGLPTSLQELGLKDLTEDELQKVSETACGALVMKNMPFEVMPNDIFAAIIKTEKEY